MPSQQYFEELTRAVLTDVDQVQGFSQRQSPEQLQQWRYLRQSSRH